MKPARVVGCGYFYHRHAIARNKSECSEGIRRCELLKLLSKAMNRKIEIVYLEKLRRGFQLHGCHRDKIPISLHLNEADFAIDSTISYKFSPFVHFSPPTEINSVAFAALKDVQMSKDLVIFYPFQLSVWLCIAVSLFVCSLVVSAMARINSTKKTKIKGFWQRTACCFEVFTGVRDFRIIRGNAKRELFCAIGCLSMRILTCCFCAVLLSYLLAPMTTPSAKTFAELGKAAKLDKIKISLRCWRCIMSNDNIEASVIDKITAGLDTDGILKSIYENSLRHRSQKPGRPHHFLMEGYTLVQRVDYLKEEAPYFKDIFISNDRLDMDFVGLLYRKDFAEIEMFNRAVLKIIESRLYAMVVERQAYKFTRGRHEMFKTQKMESTQTKNEIPISCFDLRGAFIIYAIGISLALTAFICERYFNKGNHPNHRNRKRRVCAA